MPSWTDWIPELSQLITKQLRQRYSELFGDATNAANRVWLLRRIAWRLQAQTEGGLTERAQRRALELANDCDIRLSPPTIRRSSQEQKRASSTNELAEWDRRLPMPGTVLCRVYKGKETRRKGKWSGGRPILGFDIDKPNGKLIVNQVEAEQVKEIFSLFAEKRGLVPVLEELNRRGWMNKSWVKRSGDTIVGASFNRISLGYLLRNVLYYRKGSL